MARRRGSLNNDNLAGGNHNDRLFGNYGNDTLQGNGGNDRLNGGRGSDVLQGGDGNDVLVSRSDAGEAPIAQDINAANDPNGEVNAATRMIYANQVGLPSDDILTGGAGAGHFQIETLLNAKVSILQKHADANGVIDWAGVTGENNLVHDHWLDSIGNDTITDFNAAQGDTLTIAGHTTEVSQIEIKDVNGDGVADTVLHLRSNQGANGGAHNLDLLGTVTVLNNQLTANDFTVDAMQNYGVIRNLSQLNEAVNPLHPAATAVAPAPTPTLAPAADPVAQPAPTPVVDTTPAPVSGLDHDALAEALTPPDGTATGRAPTAGDDVLVYTDGNDNGNGGSGNDLMLGQAGNDILSGGIGDDRLDGGTGDDLLHGGAGNDLLSGGAGNDVITGDFGDDILVGGMGDDNFMGNRGEDALYGGAGDDVLNGGSDDDILMGGVGNNTIDGGSGTDAVLLAGSIADYKVSITANGVQFTGANGDTDSVSHVEQFRFLGSGETYTIDNGALALTTDTADLNDLLSDHFLQHLIADGSETSDHDVVALDHAAAPMAAAVPAAVAVPADMGMHMDMPVADAHVHAADLMAA